jgi:hypothetical protein
MRDSEKIAFLYLSSLAMGKVAYEPDGNRPPDFLLDGRIAIEVRRLNQNEVTESGSLRGLEVVQFPLLESMKEVLASVGPPRTGKSWFVSYHFRRPIPPWIELKREVRNTLLAFQSGNTACTEFAIANHFHLRLIPSEKVFADCFVLGGFTDLDQGGWVIPELEKNIRSCIREKNRKVVKFRANYREWWLVLIDYINYGEREPLCVKHDWDKVILVSPLNHKRAYEI